MERKTFSRKREQALHRLVDDTIADFRRRALAGELSVIPPRQRDARIGELLGWLPDAVAEEYRRHYVPRRRHRPIDTLTAPLFEEATA